MTATLMPDPALLRRYDRTGPRYTSYPTANRFEERFGEDAYREQARLSNADPIPQRLSLYFHLPFCDTLCFYCACNKIVTRNRLRSVPYLQRLHREIALHGELFDRDRSVEQLHWGGGTPTFLSGAQMRELMRVTRDHFTLREDDGGDYSVEIDPRRVDELTIALLRDIGFNRMSLGVQDLDPAVQRAVNRVQPPEQTAAVMRAARREGFRSINLDLIYGLPRQSLASFARTLETVIAWQPDRLSVFNYAHLPELFKPQQRIRADELPGPAEKLEILALLIERLSAAGYEFIGMDHFARPDDELARARAEGKLHRNFQGFSSHADCDLVGFGVSAISKVHDCYAQNAKSMEDYIERIDAGRIPVVRGIELDGDDLVRRDVIMDLICHGRLSVDRIEWRHGVCFAEYFAAELEGLDRMAGDGLLRRDQHSIEVLPPGRLLIRNVCMVFDRYLRERKEPNRFSRVI